MINVILNNTVNTLSKGGEPESNKEDLYKYFSDTFTTLSNSIDTLDPQTILDLYYTIVEIQCLNYDTDSARLILRNFIDKRNKQPLFVLLKQAFFEEDETNTTLIDVCVSSLSARIWENYRRIYKIDNTFAQYLYQSGDIQVPIHELFYLPLNSVYLDLRNVDLGMDGREKVLGVHILVTQNYTTEGKLDAFGIVLHYMFENRYSALNCIEFDLDSCKNNNGVLVYEFKDEYNKEMLKKVKEDTELKNSMTAEGSFVDFTTVLMRINSLVINFLLYMSSKQPDIKVTKATKKGFERAERIGKPYNDVEEYEVGYRYGKAISLYTERIEREYEEHRKLEGDRKSPRPHLVQAHWHGYWCGPNRTQYEYLWVAPYFKGYGEIDCVIQDCVETDKPKYSKPEEMLYFLLSIKGIEFERQYYITEIGKYYDAVAYIDGKEVFIEYDGAQHFRPVKNWNYAETVKSDTIKNEYCRKHNIPLLRIRYDQDLYMNDIIEDLKVNYMQYKEKMNPYLTDNEYYAIRKEVLV